MQYNEQRAITMVNSEETALNFGVREQSDVHIFSATKEGAELTIHNAPDFRAAVDAQLGDAACSAVLIDFSQAGYVDSMGLGALMASRMRAQELDKRFSLYVPKGRLYKLFEITGLDGVFIMEDQPPVDPTISEQ